MEDLTELLSGSFSVTTAPNQTAAEHPRFSQYKQRTRGPNQDERRGRILETQKKRRFDYQNYSRKLAEGDLSDEQDDDDEEEMEWNEVRKPRAYSYKDQLMYSEWLVDVPPDLAEEWYLVPCPVGKRSLVVAAGGRTKVFAKNGYRVNEFPSALPGGNRKQRSDRSRHTLLDCIFNETTKTYYVLDVMCWNGHPLYDSETEFRFFWMHSKFSEYPDVSTNTSANPFRFVPLPNHACTKESIHKVLHSPMPFPVAVDGLLFYHKRTHYTAGHTPLVGWLMVYMIPEMLQIEIADDYVNSRPTNYQGMTSHISEYEKEQKDKREKRKEMAEKKRQWKSPKPKDAAMEEAEPKQSNGTDSMQTTEECPA